MKIKVKNELGNVKEIKIGFSWTLFIWGLWVPLIRLDLKYLIIMLGLSGILSLVGLYWVVPFVDIAFAFKYNQLYAKDLYNNGYRGLNQEENDILTGYIAG